MAKQRNTKVAICVSFKIKDLAQQIYDLDIDDVICLFKEVDALYSDSENSMDKNDWNTHFQQWLDERMKTSEKSYMRDSGRLVWDGWGSAPCNPHHQPLTK